MPAIGLETGIEARKVLSLLETLSPKQKELLNLLISRHAKSLNSNQIEVGAAYKILIVREAANMASAVPDDLIDEAKDAYKPRAYEFVEPPRSYAHHYEGWKEDALLSPEKVCRDCGQRFTTRRCFACKEAAA